MTGIWESGWVEERHSNQEAYFFLGLNVFDQSINVGKNNRLMKLSTEEIAEAVLCLVTQTVSLTTMSCSVCRVATVLSSSEHHSALLSFSNFSCSKTLSRITFNLD